MKNVVSQSVAALQNSKKMPFVLGRMWDHGTAFERSLSLAYHHADQSQKRRLLLSFPETFSKHYINLLTEEK